MSSPIYLALYGIVLGLCIFVLGYHAAHRIQGRNAPWAWLFGVTASIVGIFVLVHQSALPNIPAAWAASLGIGGLALATLSLLTTWLQWTRRGIPQTGKGELPPGFPLPLISVAGMTVVNTHAMSGGGLLGILSLAVMLVGGLAPLFLIFALVKKSSRASQENSTSAEPTIH